jgi:hypothetical protein
MNITTHLENFHIRSTVMNTIIWKISSTNHKVKKQEEHDRHQNDSLGELS